MRVSPRCEGSHCPVPTQMTPAGGHSGPSPAAMPEERSLLERVLNVERSDVHGLPLSALANLCTIGSYYYLQPLGDTLALSIGLEFTPLVTVGNMVLIVILNPIYAAVVRVLPTEAIVAVMFRVVSAMLLVFAALFASLPGEQLLSFCFAVYVGTLSLFTTTTLNARLASLHTKAQAKRVYGMIAAGSQTGQLLSSLSAPLLFGKLGNLVVIPSAVLYECAVQLIACRAKVTNPALDAANDEADWQEQKAKEDAKAAERDGIPSAEGALSGLRACCTSAFGGFAILASTPFLRAITGHTLLITFLVSGVWYERAAAVSAAFATEDERYDFFATLNACVGVLTLVVQTLCFSHILKCLGFHGTLCAEPIALIIGLSIAIVHPGLASIAVLDGMRKVGTLPAAAAREQTAHASARTRTHTHTRARARTCAQSAACHRRALVRGLRGRRALTPAARLHRLCGRCCIIHSSSRPRRGCTRPRAPPTPPSTPLHACALLTCTCSVCTLCARCVLQVRGAPARCRLHRQAVTGHPRVPYGLPDRGGLLHVGDEGGPRPTDAPVPTPRCVVSVGGQLVLAWNPRRAPPEGAGGARAGDDVGARAQPIDGEPYHRSERARACASLAAPTTTPAHDAGRRRRSAHWISGRAVQGPRCDGLSACRTPPAAHATRPRTSTPQIRHMCSREDALNISVGCHLSHYCVNIYRTNTARARLRTSYGYGCPRCDLRRRTCVNIRTQSRERISSLDSFGIWCAAPRQRRRQSARLTRVFSATSQIMCQGPE